MNRSSQSLVRVVFRGSTQISLASVASRLFSLLAIPYLSHWLGPDSYGALALASTIVNLGSTVGLLGLDLAYSRYFLTAGQSKRLQIESFCWTAACSSATLMAFIISIGWQMWGHYFITFGHKAIAIYIAPAIVCGVMAALASTRIRIAGNYRRISVVMVVSGAVSTAAVLLLTIAGMRTVVPLLVGALLAQVVSLLMLGLPAASAGNLANLRLDPSLARQIFLLGSASTFTATLYWLITSSDRWFLAAFSNQAELGIYSLAATLASSGLFVNSAINMTFFPEAIRMYVKQTHEERLEIAGLVELIILLLLFVALFIAILGPAILRIFTSESFHGGTVYMPWFAMGMFFYGVAATGMLPFFLAGKMNSTVLIWFSAASFAILANAWLIPHFGALGAAISQATSFALAALLTLLLGPRVLRLPLRLDRLFFALLAGLIGIFLCGEWSFAHPLHEIGSKLPVYIIISIVLAKVVLRERLQEYRIRIFESF